MGLGLSLQLLWFIIPT